MDKLVAQDISRSHDDPRPDNDAGLNRVDKIEEAILQTTWTYYHDGLNQSALAKKLNTSRASVVITLSASGLSELFLMAMDDYRRVAATVLNSMPPGGSTSP